ncbi:MAG: HEAT repeat domain-containing protein [Promethearchaeota archaeon]
MSKELKKKPRSSAWNRFIYEFFERSAYEQWHDGVNYDVVLYLEGEEREEAEDILIESVKKGDMWPTKGLAALKSKKALSVLKEKIKKSWGSERIRIAEAIETIEGSGQYIPVIIDELLRGPSPYTRLEAAMVLRKFPTPDVINALFEGIMDPDYLVRYHSSDSLLDIHGFEPEVSNFPDIFKLICSDLKSTEGKNPAEIYEQAAEMLKELFKNKPKKPQKEDKK